MVYGALHIEPPTFKTTSVGAVFGCACDIEFAFMERVVKKGVVVPELKPDLSTRCFHVVVATVFAVFSPIWLVIISFDSSRPAWPGHVIQEDFHERIRFEARRKP